MTQLKRTLWSSFAATLLITTWGAAVAPSWAESQVDDPAETAPQAFAPDELSRVRTSEDAESPSDLPHTSEDTVQPSLTTSEGEEEPITDQSLNAETDSTDSEVVKVGEYQSQEQIESSEDAIAKILPHDMDGRSAATLYVRNIPVLTFLGTASSSPSPAPQASQASTPSASVAASITSNGEAVKIASTQMPSDLGSILSSSSSEPAVDESDPVLRATAIAATINQLNREDFNAEDVTVKWDSDKQAYLIYVGEDVLVQVDGDTILPDTTRDPEEDALQATNRLRRLLGSAPPLTTVEGAPGQSNSLVSALQSMVTGMASWYGPGFDGNYSASGEVFNQNALTAAHPSLPFGTQVRVTNLDNGRSVIVRINDRGPHAAGRIIDLSTAAANVIGLVSSGVAPVSLEVVNTAQASAVAR